MKKLSMKAAVCDKTASFVLNTLIAEKEIAYRCVFVLTHTEQAIAIQYFDFKFFVITGQTAYIKP